MLRNAGDLTVSSPQVAFYYDAVGTSQISSTQTPPDLSAGYTITVQIADTIPTGQAHTLMTRANPNGKDRGRLGIKPSKKGRS